MRKRGQVTVFAIVGIVLVILIALFFFLRNEFGFFVSPTTFLNEKARPIEDNLKSCLNQAVSNSVDTFGEQGGDFNPSSYRFYQNRLVKYYCMNIPGEERCMNVMPQLVGLVGELNEKIQQDVRSCVDEDLVKSGLGYEVSAGELTTSTTTGSRGIVVTVDYNVDIVKDESRTSVRGVSASYDVPIEDIYTAALDIVNSEANAGFFEQGIYMLNKRGQFVINVDKPYPDKIYKINKKDSEFEFWFAVQGERNI